jgi:hypothetical protein
LDLVAKAAVSGTHVKDEDKTKEKPEYRVSGVK